MKPLIAAFLCALNLTAQTQKVGAPHPEGEALFRSNCAFCHGVTGAGGRGPNLTGQLVHGSSIDAIKQVIRNGIPGTQMPSYQSFDSEELTTLARYVRSFSERSSGAATVAGDPVKGRQLYVARGCANCHRVGNEGSVYGPELTRIGAARSLDYLRESIVHPSADIPEEYSAVTAVRKDGRRVTGVRVNEDTFSVQIRTPNGRFQNLDKAELKETIAEKNSLMPAYQLPAPELDNLLAYLYSLRSEASANALVEKSKGIQ